MANNLKYNIGGVSFNTKLLRDIPDDTDISFGNIWVTDIEILVTEYFDLFIIVNNDGKTSKDVYLNIYSEEVSYQGVTSTVTIASGTGYTFVFNDAFENIYGYQPIRIEAYIGDINYISTTFTVFIYGDFRILTTGDLRQLTDGNYRVLPTV